MTSRPRPWMWTSLLLSVATTLPAQKPAPVPSWVPAGLADASLRERAHSHQGPQLQGGKLERMLVRSRIVSRPGLPPPAGRIDAVRPGEPPVTLQVLRALPAPCASPSSSSDSDGLILYDVTLDGQNPCQGEPFQPLDACEQAHAQRYRGRAVAVQGGWDSRFSHITALPGQPIATFSCMSGALAKCLRFGYRPWASTNAEAPALLQSCVRALRADYCGNGRSHTCLGTSIDIADVRGIQHRDTRDPAAARREAHEADWTPDGAVCLEMPRLPGCSPRQRDTLREDIRAECTAHGHPLQIGDCSKTCPAGSETCGQPLRTWSTPDPNHPCETSLRECPP